MSWIHKMINVKSVLKLKGFPLESANELLETIPVAESDFLSWQEAARLSIVKFHYDNNPFYRSLISKGALDNWNALPVMEKSHYQRPLNELITPSLDRHQIYIDSTSGSSGNPFFYAKDKFCHALTWVWIEKRYREIGIDLQDYQARFYGIPLEWKAFAVEKIKDYLMNRKRFPVYDLSDKTLTAFLNRFRKKPFQYIYGYTTSIVLFSRFLIKNHILLKSVCPTLALVLVTSELCTPEDRLLIERATGVPVYIEYGASELGVLAIENTQQELTGSDDLLFFETLDTGNGIKQLLCTALFNKAFPIIRYKIGDIVSLEKKMGRTVFRKLDGRTNDICVLPSGKVAGGMTFYYISRSILEQLGKIDEFIIRQVAIDHLIFDIVSSRGIGVEDENGVLEIIRNYLEPGVRVTFNYVSKIHRPSSGKIKHFYSELTSKV